MSGASLVITEWFRSLSLQCRGDGGISAACSLPLSAASATTPTEC
jgi:hypothetical protein